MIARRKLTTLDKLKIVVAQAKCPRCGEKLGELDGLDFDHAHPLALGGADTLDNLRALHRDCHRVKTSGTKATSAGSDIHAIAKAKRIARKRADHLQAVAAKGVDINVDIPRPRSKWPSQKLRSRNTFKDRRSK